MSDTPDPQRPSEAHLPAEELSTLLRVSRALAASLELSVVLQAAVESTVEVLRLDTGAIYLLDGGDFYLGATTPPLPPDFPDELRHAHLADHPNARDSIDRGVPVRVHDAAKASLSPAERAVTEARDLHSLLFVPLLVKDKPVGVVIVGTTDSVRVFDDQDIDLCSTLSYQMALAVENARLFDSVTKANAEIKRINRNLESLVEERTEQLAQANEELQCQSEELQCQTEELQSQAVELHEKTQILADLSETRGRFLRSMSHELRTPLNSIIGFTNLMLRGMVGEISEEQRRQLEMVNASGRHLLELINGIMDLAKIDAGVLEVSCVPVDVASLVDEVAHSVEALARSKRLDVVMRIPAPAPLLHSDPLRVKQVLINLAGNAVKYTSAGTVTISAEQSEGGSVVFCVADTGPGIPADQIEAVFGEFKRGELVMNPNTEGAGLGLSIARQLAHALGGELTVESEIGRGSEFRFRVPSCKPVSD